MTFASWINFHALPPSMNPIFEIRVPEGYGARWSILDGVCNFRGFLEPQMEQGHSIGWRH